MTFEELFASTLNKIAVSARYAFSTPRSTRWVECSVATQANKWNKKAKNKIEDSDAFSELECRR